LKIRLGAGKSPPPSCGRKGASVRPVKILFVAVALSVLGGCAPTQKSAPSSGKVQLTVDFQQGQPIKYRFISSRVVTVDWGAAAGATKVDKSSESLTLVVSYTPVEVNPYGLTTIKAVCESAVVSRESRRAPGNDAAESFAGKSWTFTIGPTGKMEDRKALYDVIRQAGQRAFRADRSQGLVKEPDMIYDFIALQWFLWDSISSIPKPAAGVRVGDQWKSKLFVPAPMILFTARDVNYRLAEVRREPNDSIAVIDSNYSPLYPSPSDWPVPYTEMFQMSGMFGFLRDYRVLDLQGRGQELFNINAGRTEKYTQQYTMNIAASLPLALGVNPKITIEQTLTMDLIAGPGTRAP
jgi:hypothetical protein